MTIVVITAVLDRQLVAASTTTKAPDQAEGRVRELTGWRANGFDNISAALWGGQILDRPIHFGARSIA
jgi:hypothetical protein